MSSAMGQTTDGKSRATAAAGQKWASNVGEEQGSVVTSSSSTTSPGPADATPLTQSGPDEIDEKENQNRSHRERPQEIQNPQDATIRKVDDPDSNQQLQSPDLVGGNNASISQSPRSSKKNSSTAPSSKHKRRRQGRYVRVAAVNESNNDVMTGSSLLIPSNQYETTLRRRAIRKIGEGGPDSVVATKSFEEEWRVAVKEDGGQSESEDYGDISLGMKLIVAGGRVIVQRIIPLSDGRASPAQLVGVIRRGDVLLSIDNLSLVNLPIDQLMDGLKPLSSPLGHEGAYQRILKLRFESGAGTDLLESHEAAQKAAIDRKEVMDAANDMFSLFPMVDQLSGTPMFEDHKIVESKTVDVLDTQQTNPSPNLIPTALNGDQEPLGMKSGQTPHTHISSILARQRREDRRRFASDFFTYKDDLSAWLRTATGMKYRMDKQNGMGMTQSERLEMGAKVMEVVKSLSYNIENLDRGADMRSFRKYTASLSLRSRATVRRRRVLDSASLPTNRLDSQSAIDEIGSVDSGDSGSLEGIDGDELLLGLAAHDGIWRKQVLDTLNTAINEMKNDTIDEKQEEKEVADSTQDIDSALTKELGTFLFGENMSRIITQRKKSYALPPKDVTSVLFDLTTNIASSAPDEITVFGQGQQASRSVRSTHSKKKHSASSDGILAALFILNDALPIWLESFRPLPWDQRRVLWPRLKVSSADSNGGTNTIFSDDSLTVDSANSSTRSPAVKRNLREIIEDQELDIETRAETCFLVTYYFTQKVLSAYAFPNRKDARDILQSTDEESARFIKRYGAYLQMHTSLTYAALVNAESVIKELLLVAEHDLVHHDATREIRKGNTLTFYDHCKLSAVLKFLGELRYETKPERRQLCINLCVAAYPDVQPWQVRQACLDFKHTPGDRKSTPACPEETMSEVFYKYLTQLLDPLEGHDAARQHWDLVKEWCDLSIRDVSSSRGAKTKIQSHEKERLQNFFSVASRASSHHLVYRRDLASLLDMSMSIQHHDLALDLAGELLENDNFMKIEVVEKILHFVREIARDSLVAARNIDRRPDAFRRLKRVVRLFHSMSTSATPACHESIVVANELHSLLLEWKRDPILSESDPECLDLLDFFVAESSPTDVLHTLYLWTDSIDLGSVVLPRLEETLRRGVCSSFHRELSATLLRLKFARLWIGNDESIPYHDQGPVSPSSDGCGIYKKLSRGNLTIDK